MNMRTSCMILTVFLFAGCAAMTLTNEWEARGYSEQDVALATEHRDRYLRMLISGDISDSNYRFSGGQKLSVAEQRVRNIFCTCIKRLGEKCRKPPRGLASKDKELWAKSNGAEMALRQQTVTGLGMYSAEEGAVDDAECN